MRLRCWLESFTRGHRLELQPHEGLQNRPVIVLLLGSVLKALGVPIWAVVKTFAVGVPLCGWASRFPRTSTAVDQDTCMGRLSDRGVPHLVWPWSSLVLTAS